MYKISQYVQSLLKPVYGLNTVIKQDYKKLPDVGVYISNHQVTLDIVTLAKACRPNTVTVGKTQIAYVPFFGWMYWAAGNILLSRKQAKKAAETIRYIIQKIRSDRLSVWLFPEGTRSYGRYEMAEFKTGAFVAAIEAQVPIIPVVVSDLTKYKLGKFDNGNCIIKYLDPINTKGLTRADAKWLAAHLREVLLTEYRQLNAQIAAGDLTGTKSKVEFVTVKYEDWMEEAPTWTHLRPARPKRPMQAAQSDNSISASEADIMPAVSPSIETSIVPITTHKQPDADALAQPAKTIEKSFKENIEEPKETNDGK